MTIHWWDTNKLVVQLAEGRVSEQDGLRYAMISAVIYSVATYYATWFGGYQSWVLVVEFFVIVAVSCVGVSECFKANGGVHSVDFLKRLTVIAVPVGIKVWLVGIAVSQVVFYGFPQVVTTATFRNPEFIYQLYSFVFTGVIMVIFYWRISHHLARVVLAARSNHFAHQSLIKDATQHPSP